ncbi:MAG: photosystem II stability/assembly factor-like uncharacterized protein [Salibacteraceae bacterium]|jgi:photosystem II stability/assembly factor-like uncharacterized protein
MKTLLITLFVLTANLLTAQPWYNVSVPTTNKLNDIDFPTSTTGYIVGDSTTILKSTDGGETWVELNHIGLSISAFSHEIVDVDFVDEQVGFVTILNDNGGVYKTVDGGINWTPASNSGSNMCYKSCTYVTSEDDYLVGGAGCFQSGQIDKYYNSTWSISTVNYESFDPGQYVTDIDFNNGIGMAALNNEYFLRSIDDGLTWDTIPSGLANTFNLTSVMFATADSVYAGYEDLNSGGFGILRSYDAGLTWSQDINSALFLYPSFLSLGKANNGDVYCGAAKQTGWLQAIIFETTDGVNWSYDVVDQAINGIDSYGQDVTFAVGDSGYVVVNTEVASLGLNDEDYFYPINVYPNPASDFITIENEFNKNVVYNLVEMNGKVVVADIVATNGTIIDISRLETGIYYLKPTDNQFNTVHRIMKL